MHSLKQSQPDFADRRETGYGVPQPVNRNLPRNGDGGRVQQLRDTRTDESDAEQVASVGVDHHPGPPGVSVGIKFGAHYRIADLDVEVRTR